MNDGTGIGWIETDPQGGEDSGDGAQEIRDLRVGLRKRLEKEHVLPAPAGVGGEHKGGSAKAYYQSAQPTTQPDGLTALAAGDAGRLWVDKDDVSLSVVNDLDGSFLAVVPKSGSITKAMVADGFLFGLYPQAIIHESATNNINGGNFTQSSWEPRLNSRSAGITGAVTEDLGAVINTFDPATGIITLTAGTYRVRAKAVAYQVGGHQIRFRNITDSITPGLGSSARGGTTTEVVTESSLTCRFTITATKNFRLEHFCNNTKNTDGFGKAAATGTAERYAEAEITKEL